MIPLLVDTWPDFGLFRVVRPCDATPRNQAKCEKNIFEIFAVLESTHCPDHSGINFMKNGLILQELQQIEKINSLSASLPVVRDCSVTHCYYESISYPIILLFQKVTFKMS